MPGPSDLPAGSAPSQLPSLHPRDGGLFFVEASICSGKSELLPNLFGAVTSMLQCDRAQSPRALQK